MSMKTKVAAGIFGLAVAVSVVPVSAEVLRVMSGQASGALNVPMNRAVVVESDVPFSELSIANPGIADISTISDRTIYVLGKAPGRTTLTLLSAEGKLISNVDVHVTPDIAEFKERLAQILPNEKIEVRTANDGIVLSGTISSTARLDRALDLARRYAPDRVSNLMVVGGTQQVMLKVRFAEMQRSVSKGLSASIRAGGSSGNWSGGILGGPNNTANNIPGGSFTSAAQGALGLGFSSGPYQLGILLEALESKGMVRTLAEPNLTALSGQEARFLAGGEYPIPVMQNGGGTGGNSITVEYKPFGVELNFTPYVVDGDIINLQINAAVSSIDTTVSVPTGAGSQINGFKRRETTTTVEMRDGESFAIAGLLQDDFRNSASQVPWIGDVPILGALFRSTDFMRNQSELVIIVTPHLVSPVRGEALALPTDRVRIPTESEMFLYGDMAKPARGAAGEVARQDFSSSYGYVME
ncbi:type II and III secretion system protein family protein [Paracoccus sp. IB05]|uniref:type II and III secretion system protein family protein n=1 Tax=Paracoccus sp. IB05 TaxID=2779367 RepID=UPI0018E71416|nr:type II and III secretion system protein family protein [Paracoccus sp. IB05]MBJ2151852.1 type II and III secretion system protein family protein [Paracoccus sp. IB05]